MSNILVTLLAVSVGIMLQGCNAAPWLEDMVNQENISSLASPCKIDADCLMDGWEAPYPLCDKGWCRCMYPNLCRQRTITENWETYAYYCGQCGQMGSSCPSSNECPSPFANCHDGYCKCLKGSIFRGICRVDNIVSSASTTNIVLCFLLLLLLVLNKVVASKRVRDLLLRARACCMNRAHTGASHPHVGADGVYHNPRSGEKTASYTISNSDFITSSDDPDLDWAIELSRQLQQESSQRQGGRSNSISSSIRASMRSRASNLERSSTRSRASNTSGRSVVGGSETTTRREGGGGGGGEGGESNAVWTETSTEIRDTIDGVSQTASDPAMDATAVDSVSGTPAFQENSIKIDSDRDGSLATQENKLISSVRNVDENKQTSSQKEKFLLNTKATDSPRDACDDAAASNPLKAPLESTDSTSSGGGPLAESTLAEEVTSSTQGSRSKKSPIDETECRENASNNTGNKVAGRGRQIILVPRKTYFSPRNGVSALIS